MKVIIPTLLVSNACVILFAFYVIINREVAKNTFSEDRNSFWYQRGGSEFDSISFVTIKYMENKTGRTVNYKPIYIKAIPKIDSVNKDSYTIVHHLYYLGKRDLNHMYSIRFLIKNNHEVKEIYASKASQDKAILETIDDLEPIKEIIEKHNLERIINKY